MVEAVSAGLPVSMQPAWLRGVYLVDGAAEAVVTLAAWQFLRLPVPLRERAMWEHHIGERVWVDLSATPAHLSLSAPQEDDHDQSHR
jgi:hypothetical protein